MTTDARVEEERIDQLFARVPTALATVVVNASILGVLLARKHPLLSVAVWVGALVLVSIGRGIQLARFRRADDPDPKVWERRFAIGAVLNGIGWGVGGALFVSDDFPLTVALVFVIGGMVAGASASTAPSRPAFLGFALPASLPMIAHLAWIGDGVHLLMAFMLLLFVGAMSVLARQSGTALVDAMRLRFENADLAEELASSARQHGRRMRYLLDRAGVALLVADARSLQIVDTSENLSSLLGIDDVGETLDGLPIDLVDAASWREEVERASSREHGIVLSGRNERCPELEVVLTVRELDAEQLALLVIKDATDQRRMEMQLARSAMLASLGTLASGVAHEINNPLTYVLANLGQIQRWALEQNAADQIERMLTETIEGAHHIEEIVRDLVETSAPRESGSEHTDVADATRRAVRLIASEIEHRAQLDVQIADAGHAAADASQLLQVVLSLLMNAMQSMPLGRAGENQLRVLVSRRGDEATITITDTGCGMDAVTRDRVFEPFFTTKKVGEGSGLGLSGAHAIVTSIGGRIEVESELDRGSTFRVYLPVTDVEKRVSSPRPDGAASGLRILLIDDDQRVARAIIRLLGKHEVEWVQSGRDALERIGETWDVVLCDLMMPEMSGPELYERVRGARPELLPRIVFVTGGAFSDEATSFIEKERPRVIYKPFGKDALDALLAERR